MLFIVGLWPFNFTEKNEARIYTEGGLDIARFGTVYTASPSEKLHNLDRFTIFIELTTASNGLSAFEKIIGYFTNQKDMNFIVGQWKDGVSFHLPDEKRQRVIHFGAEGLLRVDERTTLLISYDGLKLVLLQDGRARIYRETGPLSFSGWSREYPLVIGTDADGKGQWKGTIYEIAVFDRALTSDEVRRLSGPSSLSGPSGREGKEVTSNKKQAARKENPPQSPFTKGGGHEKSQDKRPLIHYIFNPENTYETEFRGKKALAVRDLGKGEPADLVIPEHFEPYERAFLGWDPDWAKNKTNWLDTVVNVVGFIPLGILLFVQFANRRMGFGFRASGVGTNDRIPDSGFQLRDAALRLVSGLGLPDSGFGIKKENPPVSPFTKGGGLVFTVGLAVLVGVGVSFAIEYLQAYLPSRDSSLRDLITNGIGTFIGALAAALYTQRKPSCK